MQSITSLNNNQNQLLPKSKHALLSDDHNAESTPPLLKEKDGERRQKRPADPISKGGRRKKERGREEREIWTDRPSAASRRSERRERREKGGKRSEEGLTTAVEDSRGGGGRGREGEGSGTR